MINQIHKDYIKYKDIVKEHGYILNKQIKSNLLFIKLRNGQVKHEIKYFNNYKQIRTAYKHKDLDKIKTYMIEKGFNIGNELAIDKLCATAEFKNINEWLELAVALEDVKGISVKKKLNDDKAFDTIVDFARIALRDGNTAYLDRGFFDKLDHLVAVNKPLVKNSYREHIVPLTMVIDEIFRMIKDDNATNAQIVEMMKKNVKVYHITEKQAEYLDIKLGLRTTMPKDWKFGDDEFARIKLLKEAA